MQGRTNCHKPVALEFPRDNRPAQALLFLALLFCSCRALEGERGALLIRLWRWRSVAAASMALLELAPAAARAGVVSSGLQRQNCTSTVSRLLWSCVKRVCASKALAGRTLNLT